MNIEQSIDLLNSIKEAGLDFANVHINKAEELYGLKYDNLTRSEYGKLITYLDKNTIAYTAQAVEVMGTDDITYTLEIY